MAYTLESLANDIRTTLQKDPTTNGRQAVCKLVSKALVDKEFVAAHLTEEQCKPRKVLYEDPEMGFCICGHVNPGAAKSAPHDHGMSWAIYGQAVGETVMTDWLIVKRAQEGQPALVREAQSYAMRPGDARLYDVGDVHSPRRESATKLIRIEGRNLDHEKRSHIRAA
jgi:hypothetical protein